MKTYWKCAFVWSFASNIMNYQRLDAIQKGTEQQRNSMYEFKETFAAIVAPALIARRKEAENARQVEQQGAADSPPRIEADKG